MRNEGVEFGRVGIGAEQRRDKLNRSGRAILDSRYRGSDSSRPSAGPPKARALSRRSASVVTRTSYWASVVSARIGSSQNDPFLTSRAFVAYVPIGRCRSAGFASERALGMNRTVTASCKGLARSFCEAAN